MTRTVHGLCAHFTAYGRYRGRNGVEALESCPDPARLFAALVYAAGVGPDADYDPVYGTAVSDEYRRVLEWIENNPPTYLTLQDGPPVAFDFTGVGRRVTTPVKSYRNTGLIYSKTKEKGITQSSERPYMGGHVLPGPVCFGWNDAMPDDVRELIIRAASQVDHLGSPEYPVQLRWEEFTPTLALATDCSPFESGTVAVPVAGPGRLEELDVRHRARFGGRGWPKPGVNEASNEIDRAAKMRDRRSCVRHAVYRHVDLQWMDRAAGPWHVGLWFPISAAESRTVTDDSRLRWAVAMHRAVIRHSTDYAAPQELTGRCVDGERLPNNVAFQFIPDLDSPEWGGVPGHALGRGPGLLMMIPADTPGDRLAAITGAASEVSLLTSSAPGKKSEEIHLGAPVTVDASRWWDAPADGYERVWSVYPLMVPESRRATDARSLVRNSLGHALRQHGSTCAYPVPDDAVRGAFHVQDRNLIPNYVHKVPTRRGRNGRLIPFPAQGVLATVDLDGLRDRVSDRAAISIGQSRHLSGGLLIPIDLPREESTCQN